LEVFGSVFEFIQISALHNVGKQRIDQQIFNRKSISRNTTHRQSMNHIQIEFE